MSQKRKDTYYNKNLLDAQKEFEEKRHDRKADVQKSNGSFTHPPDKGNASKPPDRNFGFQKDEEYTQGSQSNKISGNYYNRNLQEAQKDYQETFHRKDGQLSGSQASSNYLIGSPSPESQIGKMQIGTKAPDKGNTSKPPDRNFRFQKDEEYTQGSQSNKISGNYYNRNLQEAHKDYQETFHRKNGQLSGSQASSNYLTGSPVPENQIGKMQIGTKAPTSIGSKVARVERLILKTGGKFAATTATSGSDAGAGLQFSAELSMVAIGTIANNAKITISNGMNSIMNTKLSELGESLLSAQGNGTLKCPDLALKQISMLQLNNRKNVEQSIRAINEILRANGYAPIIAMQGKIGYINVMKQLHRNKALPVEIKTLYKTLASLYQNQYMMNSGTRLSAIKRYALTYIQKYLQQSDVGRGLVFSVMFVRRAANTLRYGLTLIRTTAKAARFATLTSAKAAAWAAAKAASTKLGTAAVAGAKNIGNAALSKIAKGTPAPVKKAAKKTVRGARKGKGFIRRSFDRFNNFRKDPFHINSHLLDIKGKLGKKLSNSKVGKLLKKPVRVLGKVFSPFNWVKNIIGRFFTIISTIISTIFSILLIMFAIIIIGLLLVMVVTSVVSSIVSLFDFSASEEEIRNAALNQIKSCYESQNNEISAMYSRYRNVTVTYKDVKDEEAYQENIPDYKFTETTNSAELLSMAMVYFDFDLEEAGKTAVTDYIRKLYNGSHTTSVATQTYTYWIDEDTVETYTDANVTLTTYYFNDLFSCKLKDNFGTLSGSNTAEQVWNYFISAGFTPEATAGVMGNLYQESHLDPTAIQNGGAGPAAGICQMETYQNYNSRWGQMAKLAESRGKDWTDLSSQLDFMLSDMPSQFDAYTGKSPHYYPNGEWCWWPEKMTLESYKALTDVNKATEIFERVFERGSITRMSERYESANLYYDMYKNMTPGTDVQQKIVNAAYSQLGVNYEWGGTTPNVGLDCSGLTQYCYAQAGISIPRTSQEQSAKGKVVTNPEPGDICVSNNAGHVAIYIGNGQMIEAPDVGQQVKVSAVRAEKFVRFY